MPEYSMTACSKKLGHEITEDELVEFKIELKVSPLETLTKYFIIISPFLFQKTSLLLKKY